jgi:hypothetical protein
MPFLGLAAETGSVRNQEKLEGRAMPGKQIGEFSFKITSLTFSSSPDDGVLLQVNCEGQGPSGTVAVTLMCIPGKSGSYTTRGVQYLDNGEISTTKGSGNFESSGTHRWRIQGDVVISDGRRIHTDGEMDLASRSWSGKVFEA